MKKILALFLVSLLMVGLTGCDLFGPGDVPTVCDEGYHLEGTECVLDDVTTNQIPTITLVGAATVTIAVGSTYTDAGATANDPEDGDITASIVVNNTVNTAVAGTYTVTYNVTDSDGGAAVQKVRTVIVQAPGATAPVITLVGSNTVTITAGGTYTDAGATATDVEDGNLTASIIVVNPVDTNVPGTYTITYNVVDSSGLGAATVTRTVIVLPSDAQVLANYIVDNWDGSLQFLGMAMANMDFSTAMTLSTEINFEITEDIDEVHYVHAVITDQFVYAETGDAVKRTIDLDVDGEIQIVLSMIFQEVATGVHVYIEYGPIFDLVSAMDPEIIEMLGWAGFDGDWALFQFDDSLQSVIEIAVIKDMLVSLFFSEMGEMFFYDLQVQLETEIGFDLDQYGVDLGAFIDLLIEEDFAGAELLLQGIDVEAIALHVDYMYVAPMLYQVMSQFSIDLGLDGFDVNKLELLNTSHVDEFDVIIIDILPIDDLHGTIAFFNSLTELEKTSLIEIVIKPSLEGGLYQALQDKVNPDWLNNDFEMILSGNQQFFIDNWPFDSDPFDYATELALLQSLGAVDYWQQLTEEEQGVFYWAIDSNNKSWVIWELQHMMERPEEYRWTYRSHNHEIDLANVEMEIINIINVQYDYINTGLMIPTTDWITNIGMYGVVDWYNMLAPNEQGALMQAVGQPGMEGSQWAFDQLMKMAENPWEYQWWYSRGDMNIGVQWITDSFVELLNAHTTYLTNNYGVDVPALQANIQMYGGIEWFLYYSTQAERDMLEEISHFGGSEQYQWAVQQMMDEYYNSDWNYYIWFGRQGDILDPQRAEEDLIGLLNMYEAYLSTQYSVDVQQWRNNIYQYGAVEFFMMLNPTEQGYLDEISQMNDFWEYRWTVEVLMRAVQNPEAYFWCQSTWDHCVDDNWMTQELVALINMHQDYLTYEYGYDVPALIALIESVGATEWYMHHANGWDRDVFMELAKQGEWAYDVLWRIEDIYWTQVDVLDMLTIHETELNALGFNATQAIADINMYGIQYYVSDILTPADIEVLMEALVYPVVDDLLTALETGELPEFIMETIFTDPHVVAFLASGEYFPFDNTIIAANMLAVDFDALILETVDFEALLTAIYEGQAAYDLFVDGLALTAPNAALFFEVLSPTVYELEPYMIYVDDVLYAFDGLSLFEQYLDPSYWLVDSGMDIDLDVTPEYYVETSMIMDPIMYQIVLQDVLDTLNAYLLGFETLPFPWDENWECVDPLDEQCEDIEISNLMAILTQLGDINLGMTFDPSDPTWMQLQIDLTDFLDVVVYKSNEWILEDPSYVPDEYNDIMTGVNAAIITVTMSEGGTIVLPVAPTDVNAVAEEAAKFAMSMFARDYLRELMWYYNDNMSELANLTETTYALSDFHFLRVSKAFDPELSSIGLVLPIDPLEGPVFSLTLYWIDGTEALNGTMTLADFEAFFDIDNNLTGQAAWDGMVGLVNETNFNTTKLFLMFLLNDNEKDYNDNNNYYPE